MSWFRRGPQRAFLGLGSNLGDRLGHLESALRHLDANDDVSVVDVSGVYETEPWGGVDQDPYLNLAAAVDTTYAPRELLGFVQQVERWHGRDRDAEQRWGPRPLDIDVLLYGDRTVEERDLVVPHPRLAERAFVLVPLLEVFPGGTLPDGTRLTQLVNALAPIEGIDLHVRIEAPGGRLPRPDGPPSPGAFLADEWEQARPDGPPPGVER